MKQYILAIDQGTTSSRALIFDTDGNQLGLGQQEFSQHYPANGWVEHDAEEIWQTTVDSCHKAIADAKLEMSDVTCIGITNQRETTVVWDKTSGTPLGNAIVWQDRRTAEYCRELKANGHEPTIQTKTGLLIDPYFSATKLHWILHNVPDAQEKAKNGELAFGTIDSFLLWRLTGGDSHYTDATNASRTMLFNIHTQQWDEELLELFDIPSSILPEVKDCAANFGTTDTGVLGAAIPVTGIIGDQQAAAFGQGCFQPGMTKSTYGTGCFILMNTGREIPVSQNRLLGTVAYRLGGEVCYALEGSIFMAGATMQWIRDGLKLVDDAAQSEVLACQTTDDLEVYLVPAFTGLGAPYWDPDARGAILGMTRDTGIKEIVTAALMSVCYQTRDLVSAMLADGGELTTLRVDGGMVANNYLVQKLADILNCEVHRPKVTETTALGAAYVAGLQAGLFDSLDSISKKWQLDKAFLPEQSEQWRTARYAGWQAAVNRVKT